MACFSCELSVPGREREKREEGGNGHSRDKAKAKEFVEKSEQERVKYAEVVQSRLASSGKGEENKMRKRERTEREGPKSVATKQGRTKRASRGDNVKERR